MFLLCVLTFSFVNDKDLRLWYNLPASQLPVKGNQHGYPYDVWEENTLPIGNGRIGANVYGEISCEHLTFNEETLWIGGPSSKRPNYNGGNIIDKGLYGETLHEIQKLFEQHDDFNASKKCENLVGDRDGYGSYQVWGDIYLDYHFPESECSNYVRYLDLDEAKITVMFDYNQTTYKREFFISSPDNVLAIRLSQEGPGKQNLDIKFPIRRDNVHYQFFEPHILEGYGQLEDNELQYLSRIAVVSNGGEIIDNTDDFIFTVTDSEEVIIYVTGKTDYRHIYPHYRSNETIDDLRKNVSFLINEVINKGYDTVRSSALSDYSKYFNRVHINLSQGISQKPTNELISGYNDYSNTAEEDRALEVLIFEYGLYLQISSSHPLSQLPINGEGIWNGVNEDVPWSDDFHMNINVQMAYFPTFICDLHECAKPLLDFIDGLRAPGRVTASIYAGINSTEEEPENGFMIHTQNTPFGWTCPGWSYDWGWGPGGGLWILHNCYEYYEYTLDVEMLRNKIYPMMKEGARLYEQMFKYEYPESKLLVVTPAYSPEHGPRTNGNIYEQLITYQHFINCIKAARVLNVDEDKISEWEEIINKLKPCVQIGTDGQIKEWFDETYYGSIPYSDTSHRHMSHLLGLFPFNIINHETPEWIKAARVSLYERTDWATGWGMCQRISSWARVGDGNHAHDLLHNFLSTSVFNNLWDTCPPFQIDGNFGSVRGISEMLVQSNSKAIHLLPALPDVWSTGHIEGLVTRGNFKLNLSWSNMHLEQCQILSRSGGVCLLHYPNLGRSTVRDSQGNTKEFRILDENTIEIDTEMNDIFVVSEIPSTETLELPETVECYRYTNSQVFIQWDAVESAEAYYVYRQVGYNLPELVASNITTPSYNDTYDKDDAYYSITTEENGLKTDPIGIVNVMHLDEVSDSSPAIKYNKRYNKIYKEGTPNNSAHLLEQASIGESLEFRFVGQSVYLYALKGPKSSDLRVAVNDSIELFINMTSENESLNDEDPIHLYTYDDIDLHIIKIEAFDNSLKNIEIHGFQVIGAPTPTPAPTASPYPTPTASPMPTSQPTSQPTPFPTSTSDEPTPEPSSTSDKIDFPENASIIAGIVLAVISLIVLIIIVLIFVRRRRQNLLSLVSVYESLK